MRSSAQPARAKGKLYFPLLRNGVGLESNALTRHQVCRARMFTVLSNETYDLSKSLDADTDKWYINDSTLVWTPGPSLRGIILAHNKKVVDLSSVASFIDWSLFKYGTNDVYRPFAGDNLNATASTGYRSATTADYDPFTFDNTVGGRGRVIDAYLSIEFTNPASIVGFIQVSRFGPEKTGLDFGNLKSAMNADLYGTQVIALRPGRQVVVIPAWVSNVEKYDQYSVDDRFGAPATTTDGAIGVGSWALCGHVINLRNVGWATTDTAPSLVIIASAKAQIELNAGMNHLFTKPTNPITPAAAVKALADRATPGQHAVSGNWTMASIAQEIETGLATTAGYVQRAANAYENAMLVRGAVRVGAGLLGV